MKNIVNKRLNQAKQHLLLLCLLSSFFIVRAAAQETKLPVSGESGSCSWTLDAEGTLTISPKDPQTEGNLGDWSDVAPWHSYAASIQKVMVTGRVKPTTCKGMFEGCSLLQWLDLSGMDFPSSNCSYDNMYSNCKLPYVMVFPSSAKEVLSKVVPTFKGCTCQVAAGDLWKPEGAMVTDVSGMTSNLKQDGTTTFVQVQALKEQTVTIKKDVGWCTLCYPYSVTLEDADQKKIAAYKVSEVDSNGMLKLTQLMDDDGDEPAQSLPAFTPVLLYATNAAQLSAIPETTSVSLAPVAVHEEENLLVGVNGDAINPSVSITIKNRNQYVLQKHGEHVAFYYVEENNPKKVKPYRCYLEIPSDGSQNARPASLQIPGKSTPTGVKAPATGVDITDVLNAGKIYDMNGREANHLQKGTIYICNGLKFVIK